VTRLSLRCGDQEFRTPEELAVIARRVLAGHREERVLILGLSAHYRVTGAWLIGAPETATVSHVRVDIGAVLCALRSSSDTTQFFLAHNHPTGSSSFSYDDLTVTRELACLAAEWGIYLVDHMLVARGRVYSARRAALDIDRPVPSANRPVA